MVSIDWVFGFWGVRDSAFRLPVSRAGFHCFSTHCFEVIIDGMEYLDRVRGGGGKGTES